MITIEEALRERELQDKKYEKECIIRYGTFPPPDKLREGEVRCPGSGMIFKKGELPPKPKFFAMRQGAKPYHRSNWIRRLRPIGFLPRLWRDSPVRRRG